MSKQFLRVITGGVLLALLTVALLPNLAVAQDDGSDPEAVVERLRAAADNFDAEVDNYTLTSSTEQTLSLALEITALGQSIGQSSDSFSEIVADVITTDDSVNASGMLTFVSSAAELENGEPTSGSDTAIDVELRLVDDVLYANATSVESTDTLFDAPPADWFVLAEGISDAPDIESALVATFSTVGEWNLNALDSIAGLGADDGEGEDGDSIEEIIEVFELATEISTTTDNLPDGSAVDVVVVSVPGAALLENETEFFPLPDTSDPTTANIFDTMLNGLTLQFNFAIDDEERWRGFFFTVSASLATDDLSSILGEENVPAGLEGSLEMSLEISQSEFYTNLNVAFDPAVAPEVAAE